jgi:hypothetical protein
MAQATGDQGNNQAPMVVVHTLKLRPGIKAEDFERVMTNEVFTAAAEVAGSVNRGGRSMIESQHLLMRDGAETEYLWLTKVLSTSMFREVGQRMLEDACKRLETFAITAQSANYVVIDSLNVGQRDQSGRPIGAPTRGNTI